MTASLADFQASFFAALLAEPDAVADTDFARQPGFAVYRNTAIAACIEALGANYPAARALVGEVRFHGSALAFVRAHPPGDGVLASYGDGFPRWLGDCLADDDLQPLSVAVATLDRAWTESHLAADAQLLDPAALALLAPESFAGARLVPHPATRWLAFEDDRPAFAWWRAHREHRRHDALVENAATDSAALLMRPDDVVLWTAIDRAAVPFLAACAMGRSVADALDAAAVAAPDRPVAGWLPALMHARAFSGIAGA